MTLIKVTLRQGFAFPEDPEPETGSTEFKSKMTRDFVRKVLVPLLPGVFAQNCANFGMDHGTPEGSVRVQYREDGFYDVNVADLLVKVEFSEVYPGRESALDIRESVKTAIMNVFHRHSLMVPDNNYVLELSWGPSHGFGTVNGTHIEW